MWQLTRIELFKIFRKPRTYIAFAAIAAIIFLVQLALYADGEEYLGFVMQSVNETFDIQGKKLNGYFVCFTILQTLLVHVPLLIALVAGDMIAGEANMGTLRLLATKSVSRTSLMLSKFLASSVYTIALLSFMAFLSLFVSILIFAAVSMTTVASLAFLLSVFSENSIGPIVGTMSVIIVLTILTTMNIPFFNHLKPFLFTNHMLNWKGFFDDPVDYREVLKSALVLSFHIIVFVSLETFVFRKKDILS